MVGPLVCLGGLGLAVEHEHPSEGTRLDQLDVLVGSVAFVDDLADSRGLD